MSTNATTKTLQLWRGERDGAPHTALPHEPAVRSARHFIEHRITHYAGIAAGQCPSISEKTVTANVLRHTAAMRLLKAGVDTSVIALWPGHESIETTREFADLHLKKRALDRTRPLASPTGPIPTPDYILTWLDAL